MLCISKKHICDEKSHKSFYNFFRLFALIVVEFECLSISDEYDRSMGVRYSGNDAGTEFAKNLEAQRIIVYGNLS